MVEKGAHIWRVTNCKADTEQNSRKRPLSICSSKYIYITRSERAKRAHSYALALHVHMHMRIYPIDDLYPLRMRI